MSKTVPLKNSAVAVVKSAERLPATIPARAYADFDAFVENADKLVELVDWIDRDIERLSDIEFEWFKWSESRSLDLKKAKQEIATAKYIVDSARGVISRLPWA